MNSRSTASWRHPTEMRKTIITNKSAAKPNRPGQSKTTKREVVITTKRQQNSQLPKQRNPASPWAISDCAKKYSIALVNPRDPRATGACIPSFPSPPSQKLTSELDFSFVIGTTGIGYLAWSPSPTNDQAAVFTTTALYDSTNLAITDAMITANKVVKSPFSNQPFPASSFVPTSSSNAAVRARLVSVCLEECYTGTTNNLSGMRFHFHDPNHSGLIGINNGGINPSVLINQPGCQSAPVSRASKRVVGFSVSSDETEYPTFDDATATTGATNEMIYWPWCGGNQMNSVFTGPGQPSLIVFVTGGLPGNTHYVKLTQLSELCGNGVASISMTPSATDVVGFSMVQQAVSSMTLNQRSPDSNSMAATLSSVARQVYPHLSKAVTDMAFSYLRSKSGVLTEL